MTDPTQSIEPITRESLDEVVKFLLGEAPLDDTWFGDRAWGKPPFWWRSKLRAALLASEEREKKLREALEVIARLELPILQPTAQFARQALGE